MRLVDKLRSILEPTLCGYGEITSGPNLCLDLGGDDTLPSVRGREMLKDGDVGDEEVLPMSAI